MGGVSARNPAGEVSGCFGIRLSSWSGAGGCGRRGRFSARWSWSDARPVARRLPRARSELNFQLPRPRAQTCSSVSSDDHALLPSYADSAPPGVASALRPHCQARPDPATAQERPAPVQVSWNVNGRGGATLWRQIAALAGRCRRAAGGPGRGPAGVARRLGGGGPAAPARQLGPTRCRSCERRRVPADLLASRWPLRRPPSLRLEFPERYLAAEVGRDGGPC